MRYRDSHIVVALVAALRDGEVQSDGRRYRLNESRPRQAIALAQLARQLFAPQSGAPADRELFDWLHARLREQTEGRPAETPEFRQQHVTLRTSLLRALYLSYRGDIEGKRIVLLGDDDLTSLAIALVGGYASLHVLEIDSRLIEFLRERLGDRVEVLQWDANDTAPSEVVAKTDTFFCDPSRRVYDLFLRRGLELAAPDGVLYFCANPSHASPLEFAPFMRSLLEAGLVLTDVIPSFNEYVRGTKRGEGYDAQLGQRSPGEGSPAEENISFTESLVRTVTPSGAERRR
jgi:predicted methyltransferase